MTPHACSSLRTLYRRRFDHVATVCGSQRRTGESFCRRVSALAEGLVRDVGVRSGDRVALLGTSSDLFFEAFLAVLCCGGVAAPLNWRWSAREAVEACLTCEATVLLVDPSAMEVGQEVAKVRVDVFFPLPTTA